MIYDAQMSHIIRRSQPKQGCIGVFGNLWSKEFQKQKYSVLGSTGVGVKHSIGSVPAAGNIG